MDTMYYTSAHYYNDYVTTIPLFPIHDANAAVNTAVLKVENSKVAVNA